MSVNKPVNTMAVDLTSGSILKTLLLFAWPTMLSNALQMFYNLVDMAVVGQYVGKEGLAAVTNGGELTVLVTFFCMGFSTAGQVIIAQNLGKGQKENLNRIIGTLLSCTMILSLIMSVLSLMLADWALDVLNVPEASLAMARQYTVCCYTGLFFIYGYNILSAILRGMGDSIRPLIFIAVAAGTNVILDLVFVAGLKWGALGAALATVLGQALSFLGSLIYLYRRREAFGFDFRLRSFAIDFTVFKTLLRLGLPIAVETCLIQLSRMFVASFINAFGVAPSALNGIGNKLGQCASVVTKALGTAVASFVGQCFGAGKMDRAVRAVYVSLGIGLSFSSLLALLIILFPTQIFGFFNDDPAVLEMLPGYIPIVVMLFYGFALRNPFLGFSNGLGNGSMAVVVGLLDGVVARIGLSLLFGVVLDWGIQGFWIGSVLAGFLPFVIVGIYFWSGLWKKRKVLI